MKWLSATVYIATKLLTRWKTNNIRLKALETAGISCWMWKIVIDVNAHCLEAEAVRWMKSNTIESKYGGSDKCKER